MPSIGSSSLIIPESLGVGAGESLDEDLGAGSTDRSVYSFVAVLLANLTPKGAACRYLAALACRSRLLSCGRKRDMLARSVLESPRLAKRLGKVPQARGVAAPVND